MTYLYSHLHPCFGGLEPQPRAPRRHSEVLDLIRRPPIVSLFLIPTFFI